MIGGMESALWEGKPTQPTTRHSRRGRTGRERHDVEADVDEGDPQAQTATDHAEHAATTPHQRQASSSSNKEQAFVIVVPVGLSPELHQCAPEYFLVVDSGATVHCLWDATCTAHLTEQNSSIGWGGVGSRSVCIATGHLCGATFC